MLIDDFKYYFPNLTMDNVIIKEEIKIGVLKIKDAVTFYIPENPKNIIENGSEKNMCLASYLPFQNIFLQLDSRFGIWFTEYTFTSKSLIKKFGSNSRLLSFTLLHLPKKITNLDLKVNTYFNVIYSINARIDNCRTICIKNNEKIHPDKWDQVTYSHFLGSIIILSQFLDFISCKNIKMIKKTPSKTVNKKRIKKGKKPFNSYYILKIKNTNQQPSVNSNDTWSNRIHICRGHFKEYTEEKPLFGRFTGRYWWTPQVRGNKRTGIIKKDYLITK